MRPDRPDQGADTPNDYKPPLGSADPVVRYLVADLLRGGREAVLEHGGAEYRLRITANGRLILTK
jgi:hemin uptake protein HemP